MMKENPPSNTQVLREILLEGKARTQAEIKNELDKRHIQVSQPNVSRLLHKIGAVKLVDAEGKTQYRLPHESGLIHELTSIQEKNIISQWLLDIVSNENLVIIYTTPGAANLVARIVDQHRLTLKVIGSIAGDDTIFVAPARDTSIERVVQLIKELFKL